MNIAKLKGYLQIEPTHYNQPGIEILDYYTTRFMLTVPFENTDVQNGKPISVDIDALLNKIVYDKRSGFCYELNTSSKAYLQQKGFDPELMSVTIHTPGGDRSQNGSHASPVASINNVFYVTDVGSGDLPLDAIPITLPDGTQQITNISGTFHTVFNNEDKDIFYVQKYENSHWHTKYKAEFKAREVGEFDQNIKYNQTCPDSVFVKHLLITIPQSFGRATVSGNHLTLTKDGTPEKLAITRDNYKQFLTKYLGLNATISRLENSDN